LHEQPYLQKYTLSHTSLGTLIQNVNLWYHASHFILINDMFKCACLKWKSMNCGLCEALEHTSLWLMCDLQLLEVNMLATNKHRKLITHHWEHGRCVQIECVLFRHQPHSLVCTYYHIGIMCPWNNDILLKTVSKMR
jgi:hypothetical protein